MPVDSSFMKEDKYLDPELYHTVVKELCDYGLEELRITGGEPLLRKSFSEIVRGFKNLPLKKIGLTTNAILLNRFVDILQECHIHYLNISLDSLNAENFRQITHGNKFKIVSQIVWKHFYLFILKLIIHYCCAAQKRCCKLFIVNL